MNVITTYLDTMFSPYPQTPRLLEAKAELQAMMEDAYASHTARGLSHNEAVGKVITDFGNLDDLAPVLGIAGDIAPASIASAALPAAPVTTVAPAEPPVTLEEAKGFADAHFRTRYRLAIAVALFVLSPVALITLPSAAEDGLLPFTPDVATMVGLSTLFVIVAIGVMLVIGTSREFSRYRRVQNGEFSRNPLVTSWAEDLAQQHEPGRVRALQISVMMWVLSPVPLLMLTLIPEESRYSDLFTVLGVAALLAIVAAGLLVLLPSAWAHSAMETLTGGGKAAKEEESSIVGVIAAFYWPALTAIFLAWSFIGNAWGRSWIVWPIGAVIFGALAAGGGAIEAYRKARR